MGNRRKVALSAMSVRLEKLAARFRGPAVRAGGGILVFCSVHEDRNRPSLSLAEGTDGRLLVHCFAGCPTKEVLVAVGLSIADLDARGGTRPERSICAVYNYTNGSGAQLYQVVRYPPKAFRQRRPDGHGVGGSGTSAASASGQPEPDDEAPF